MTGSSTNLPKMDLSESASNGSEGSHSFLGPAIFFSSLFFINSLSRFLIAVLMPSIEMDLGIQHGQAGSLFFMISAGYVAGLIGSSFLSARINQTRTIIISCLGAGISLGGVSFLNTLCGLRAGLFMLGLPCGLYLPSGISTLTHRIENRLWGRVLAIHQEAPMLALFLAPLLAEILLDWTSWRKGLWPLALANIAAGFVFALSRRGERAVYAFADLKNVRLIAFSPILLILVSMLALGISANLGIYSMIPLYLTSERGFSRTWTNASLSVSRLLTLASPFLGGWMSDHFGPRKTLMGVLIASGGVTVLLGLVSNDRILPVLFLQPFLAVCTFPPCFSLIAEQTEPQLRSLMLSLAMSASVIIGSGAVPMGLGMLGDAGHFGLGMVLVGVANMAGGILASVIKAGPGTTFRESTIP